MIDFVIIVKALVDLLSLGWKAKKLFDEAREKGWIQDGITLNQAIDKASSDEERSSLARKLFEHSRP